MKMLRPIQYKFYRTRTDITKDTSTVLHKCYDITSLQITVSIHDYNNVRDQNRVS